MTADAQRVARERAQAAAASVRHPLTILLLMLTFSTGLVDAVSYLGLGRVFSANMTGNIVLLGFGIAGGFDLPIVAPIVSLVAFLVGAALGGMLADTLAPRHRAHLGAALGAEVALLTVAMLVTALATVQPDAASGDTVIGLLALAMVLAMLIGALVGALLLKSDPAWVLALAAVLAAVAGAGHLRHPSSGDPA